MLLESATDGSILFSLHNPECEFLSDTPGVAVTTVKTENHLMHVIKNEFEYRMWMMKNYFLLDGIQGDSLLTEEELEDFLFESRPAQYPCLATVQPSPALPWDDEISFIYPEQISQWAKEMGVIKC